MYYFNSNQLYDVLAVWWERTERVSSEALPCGHFLPEESPNETAEAVIAFLHQHSG